VALGACCAVRRRAPQARPSLCRVMPMAWPSTSQAPSKRSAATASPRRTNKVEPAGTAVACAWCGRMYERPQHGRLWPHLLEAQVLDPQLGAVARGAVQPGLAPDRTGRGAQLHVSGHETRVATLDPHGILAAHDLLVGIEVVEVQEHRTALQAGLQPVVLPGLHRKGLRHAHAQVGVAVAQQQHVLPRVLARF